MRMDCTFYKKHGLEVYVELILLGNVLEPEEEGRAFQNIIYT